MAKNVALWGAVYTDTPALTVPVQGGGTALFVDTSDSNALASDIASGKTAYVNGEKITGTASGGAISVVDTTDAGGGTIRTITGTQVTGSWELVASKNLTVTTTSTTASMVDSWQTGVSALWTTEKYICVRVRNNNTQETYYGHDSWAIITPYDVATSTSKQAFLHRLYYVSDGYIKTASSAYGVYPVLIDNTGTINIYARIQATYAPVLNGIFTIEVYLLSPPTGKPIFG